MGNTVKIDLAKLREKLSGLVDENHISDIVNSCVIKEEAVEHPAHYQGKHECIEVMRVMFGDNAVKAFCKLNSYKYRFRSSRKNGDEDIKKAEFYEDYLINMEKDERKSINHF